MVLNRHLTSLEARPLTDIDASFMFVGLHAILVILIPWRLGSRRSRGKRQQESDEQST
jgi:hypothetical protein